MLLLTLSCLLAVCSGCVPVDRGPTQEELLEEAGASYDRVYWTETGMVYHLYEDCPHLSHEVELFEGTADAAIENGKTRMCRDCYSRGVTEGVIVEDDAG